MPLTARGAARVLSAMTLIGALAACTPDTPTTDQQPADGTSRTIVIRGANGAGSVEVVETRWTGEGRPAPSQGQYLSVHLRWRATKGQLSINPARITFEDHAGKMQDFVYYGVDVSPVLSSGQLSAGSSKEGWASFDTPAGDGFLIIKDEANNDAARIPIAGP